MSEMQAETPVNGAGQRVRFGPRPNQDMPAEWAESMLTELAARHAGLFGRLLQAAALGQDARR